MASMNLVFHLVATLAFLVLTWLWLRLKRQHDFLLELVRLNASAKSSRVFAEMPQEFLRRCCLACGVEFSELEDRGPLGIRRIDPRPWAELFVQRRVQRVQWLLTTTSSTTGQKPQRQVNLILHQESLPASESLSVWQGRLEKALGGDVVVQFV